MRRKTVVLVCMVDSIHVARWIAQFDPKEVKFILFPSGPNRRVHPKIVEMIERGKQFDNQMTLVPFGGRLSLPLWALDKFFSDRIRGLLLRGILKKLKPDFVHALEFQHAGYVTLRALADERIKTPFIATNYGSDIFWFQKFKRHQTRIRKILRRADLYSAECKRDYLLARGLGFNGAELPLGPNSGGLQLNPDVAALELASKRRVIAIKGYHGWAGRALVALKALEQLEKHLSDFEIVLFSANLVVARKARQLSRRTSLKIQINLKGSLSHRQVLEVLQKSRIFVGLSRSDGISTSLLEAMSAGAFPIQANTSCANEWITDGESGIILESINPSSTVAAIASALANDEMVDWSQKRNLEVIKAKASPDALTKSSRTFYSLDKSLS